MVTPNVKIFDNWLGNYGMDITWVFFVMFWPFTSQFCWKIQMLGCRPNVLQRTRLISALMSIQQTTRAHKLCNAVSIIGQCWCISLIKVPKCNCTLDILPFSLLAVAFSGAWVFRWTSYIHQAVRRSGQTAWARWCWPWRVHHWSEPILNWIWI